jgi:hypothetical protein
MEKGIYTGVAFKIQVRKKNKLTRQFKNHNHYFCTQATRRGGLHGYCGAKKFERLIF